MDNCVEVEQKLRQKFDEVDLEREAVMSSPRKAWERKYIDLHQKKDGYNHCILVHVADIAVLQASGMLDTQTFITLKGTGKKIEVAESFQEVRQKIMDAVDEKIETIKVEKHTRPYKIKRDCEYDGVRFVIEHRTERNMFGILCGSYNKDYYLIVEMNECIDKVIRPKLDSEVFRIGKVLVEE